jgi:hypothetical protein
MDKCTLPTHTGKTINGKPPAHSPVGDPPPPTPHSLYPGPHVSAPRRYHATPTRSATKLTRKTENIKLYLGLIKKHSAPLFSISHFSLYPSLSPPPPPLRLRVPSPLAEPAIRFLSLRAPAPHNANRPPFRRFRPPPRVSAPAAPEGYGRGSRSQRFVCCTPRTEVE